MVLVAKCLTDGKRAQRDLKDEVVMLGLKNEMLTDVVVDLRRELAVARGEIASLRQDSDGLRQELADVRGEAAALRAQTTATVGDALDRIGALEDALARYEYGG